MIVVICQNYPAPHDETVKISFIIEFEDAEVPEKPSEIPASRHLQMSSSISSWMEQPAEPAA
jgi:hypothetical protein